MLVPFGKLNMLHQEQKTLYTLGSCGQMGKPTGKKSALTFMDGGQFSNFQGHKSQL